MARDEQGFPVMPHEVATPGVACDGCLVVEVRGGQAAITCNVCGALVHNSASGAGGGRPSEVGVGRDL